MATERKTTGQILLGDSLMPGYFSTRVFQNPCHALPFGIAVSIVLRRMRLWLHQAIEPGR